MNHSPRTERPLFQLAIGLSSLLLFSIQPMMAKAILPTFGGSAGVWVTAMLFFQTVLLAGYLYSFATTRFFSRRMQRVIHGVLLVASLAVLPVKPRLDLTTHGPVLSILLVLLISVGLPYFLLSATSPLLQTWFSGEFPYRMYALSNAGSVAALLAYPIVIEPLMPASTQLRGWSIAYAALAVVLGASAVIAGGAKAARNDLESTTRRPLLWITLPACASALWLGVANHLSQEVAPIPFLWVLPLSVYLLSFIVCFGKTNWYRPLLFRWLLPLSWVAAVYNIAQPSGLRTEIAAFSAALFVWCIFCHGELARTKPESRRDLTFFYLMLALGGALGGVFVAVIAPNVFRTYLELPIGIVASVMLALPLVFGVTSKARLIRLGIVALAAFVIAVRYEAGAGDVVQLRNFYGALQVSDTGTGDNTFRSLYSGRTLHGVEFLSADRSRMATTYYGPDSGVGRVLSTNGTPRRVAAVGLGAGTIATYGRAGDFYRFYEINPAVVEIARRYFHFLDDSPARVDVLTGDGRLLLEKEPAQSFDAIVLDAFSDDSIPVHLLTKEAFAMYLRLLRHDGVIAIHLTNRYLDLEPVVESLAAAFGKSVMPVHNQADPEQHILAADWAVVYGRTQSAAPAPLKKLWTDDYSNLFQVLK